MATGRMMATGVTHGRDRVVPRASGWWWQLLFAAPLLVYAAVLPLLSETDPDYWWHARTGQFIAETGTIPRVDDYSFTVRGQPWVSHEWLSDLLIFHVAQLFGYVGVAALFGVVVLATIALVRLTCHHHGAGPVVAVFTCGWALLLMQPSVNARPQMFTMLLLALFVWLLVRYQAGDHRALWPLPLLMALWVNLHGGYLIGLVFLGLACGGVGLRWLLDRRNPAPWALAATTLLAFGASLLTPHGLDALRYPLTYVGRENASLQFVAEWRSPDFHQALFFPFAASLLLALALGLGGRLGPTATFWGLTVAFMGLQSVRHIPLYAIVATPLIAARLGAALAAAPAVRARTRELARFGVGVLAVVLPLLLLAGNLAVSAERGWQVGRAPSAAGYPAAGVAYLRTATTGERLFNEYRWGGYLIAELYPERRVFIDGRADPFGDALVTRYRDTLLARPGWAQNLDAWQIDLILVDKEGPLALALRDATGWREVLVGPVERLFVRNATAADGRMK